MAGLNSLSPVECEQISSVLKRDRQLRAIEDARIRQLKQELICLRKRAALKPGLDPLRNCSRCLTELGRILNRGAVCPLCLKKVCKDCRHYEEKNHEWLCIYCYKQIQLKAISGEWMLEFSRLTGSNRNPPCDPFWKALQDSQWKGLLENVVTDPKCSQPPVEIPPEKPARVYTYEPPLRNISFEIQGTDYHESNSADISTEKMPLKHQKNWNTKTSPKLLPRVDPWTDIDPDPTIPMRIDRSRPFGTMQQHEPMNFKERQSSDESTTGFRSRSSSCDVKEGESYSPVPLPRKRISPLKKQQAVPDPNPVNNQQSSVETTDSGICSPGIKSELSMDTNPPVSPLVLSRLSSNEQDPPSSGQCLDSESSLSDTEDNHWPQTNISGNIFTKLKSAQPKSVEEKFAGSSAANPHLMPPLGLNYPLFYHNVCSNTFCNTNFKQKLIHSYLDFPNNFRNGLGSCHKSNNYSFAGSNTQFYSKACASSCNLEALCSGVKSPSTSKGAKHYKTHVARVKYQKTLEAQKITKSKRNDQRQNCHLQFSAMRTKMNRKKRYLQSTAKSNDTPPLVKSFTDSSKGMLYDLHLRNELDAISLSNTRVEKSRNTLVRSASLPIYKTFSADWLKPWLWKCHSVEEWLWCLEEQQQPCQLRDVDDIVSILPDDYKLVYVSSASNSSDSDDCSVACEPLTNCDNFQFDVSSNAYLENSYSKSSDWELDLVDKELFLPRFYRTKIESNEINYFPVSCISRADENYCNVNRCNSENNTFKCGLNISEVKSFQKPLTYSYSSPITDIVHFTVKARIHINESALNRHSFSSCFKQRTKKSPASKEIGMGHDLKKLAIPAQRNYSDRYRYNTTHPNSQMFYMSCISFLIIDEVISDSVMYKCLQTNLQKELACCSNVEGKFPLISGSSFCTIKNVFKHYFKTICDKNPNLPCSFALFKLLSTMILNSYALNNFLKYLLYRFFSLPLATKIVLNERHFSELTDEYFVLLNTSVSLSSSLASTGEREVQFPPDIYNFFKMFRNSSRNRTVLGDSFLPTSLRCDRWEGNVGTWLQLDDANAFHYSAFPLSSYATNRSNDNSATGWGKLWCCIAVATERVMDLNPRALVCEREVLDFVDLAPYPGWEYGTDFKLNTSENLVNVHPNRSPPVLHEPETDFLLFQNKSEPCVFQRSFHAKVQTPRMIPANFEVTGVSDKTDHDKAHSFNETGQKCEGILSKNSATVVENENCLFPHFSVDTSWLMGKEKNCESSCQTFESTNARFVSHERSAFESVHHNNCSLLSLNTKDIISFNPTSCFKSDLCDSENVFDVKEHSSEFLDTEILPYVKNIFCDDIKSDEYLSYIGDLPMGLLSPVSVHDGVNERVDCQCNKPCEVPSSPSVVDATIERNIDDGEIFSSGDELDKFESDTDSQDTVIEGEAYKRIRSVAIKEKILHANEELFGSNNNKSSFLNLQCSDVYTSSGSGTYSKYDQKVNCSLDNIQSELFPQPYLQTENKYEIPELPLFSDSEESDALTVFSSLEKHFQSFKNQNVCTYHPVPLSFNDKRSVESEESFNRTDAHSLSSYCPFNESLCSSESSDNGSDGEEVILSDTSTSSDEATYVAPSSGFQYYSYPMSYKLHTIAEESCEDSERSSRNSIPLNKTHSELDYFNKSKLSVKSSRKTHHKLLPDNLNPNSEHNGKNSKSSAAYSVLATSRLEKYFKSGLQDRNKVSYPEDDTTDESGEVSSDDDTASNDMINQLVSGKKSDINKTQKVNTLINRNITPGKHSKFGNSSSLKNHSNAKVYRHIESKKVLTPDKSDFTTSEISRSEQQIKQNKASDHVSDEEAKYIMNHLMQHINNNEVHDDANAQMEDMSPMLKILESEIARLMLTVSPASLSAGEPSSSCSSTIGSNNSDYGSDTLESAEDSTSEDEINAEIAPESRPVDISLQIESDIVASQNEDSACVVSSDFVPLLDPIVSEETLYICKQLMASLKKITDSTEGTCTYDDICADGEDHSAKQYITNQIVSLMQTVNASHNSSPLLQRLSSNLSPTIPVDSDVSQDCSDSDSPPPNDDKRDHPKSKTPSESGSETTISASISIPSYDDSDRTPTESEISHEMDELYALLESNSVPQDVIASSKFSCDLDSHNVDKRMLSRNEDSPFGEDDVNFIYSESYETNPNTSESGCSLLYGAASKLESLLPISIEERIARYKDAFLNKVTDPKEHDKVSETRINVILPQPSTSENICDIPMSNSLPVNIDSVLNSLSKDKLSVVKSCDNILSSCNVRKIKSEETGYNVTSVKIISHNTYPPSSAIHKILSNNIDSTYLDQNYDCKVVSVCDSSDEKNLINAISKETVFTQDSDCNEYENESVILSPLSNVINCKEKASSENDLLVANYRTKLRGNKVFGTKSVGNICDLENISNKSVFRDTGYYSFKSSEDSFLSLDESTVSETSTASLTQYRSLTSTETIPEEEESCIKGAAAAKMSLSSSNIPDAVCGTSASKSSTLPLSLRSKFSATSNTNHRTRSSFFSTSGVLRKLTLLRDSDCPGESIASKPDDSGNSLRSSPHGRLRMRNRSLSGGSEDGRQRKISVPQISVSECLESQVCRLSSTSSEKDSFGVQDEDIEQPLAYHSRSQMSLSSFGGRSESVTSVYSAAGGGRYGTVIVTGDVLFGLTYNYKVGALEINVKECRNLAAVDTKRNRSDPYVKVYLLPDRTKSGKRKTKVKKHTLNPVFDELLKFHVTVSELEIRTLWLSVWHSDRFGRNDFLGEVMLPLGNDIFECSGLKWYPLQERMETLDAPVSYKGDLILALKFVPPDVTSRKFSKKPGIPVKGALEVLIREARNLMATRSNGTSDPFCKSYLLPDKSKGGKQKTPVFKKSCNPKWNHTFVYDDVSLDDLKDRCLELTVWDYDKITSNDFLGGVRLCFGTGKYQGRDVDWMDSVGEERSLWYTMLERPNTWVDGSLLLRPSMQNRRTV